VELLFHQLDFKITQSKLKCFFFNSIHKYGTHKQYVQSERLVQSAPTLRHTAQTGDFLVLDREFVIVGNFFINFDVSLGINNDLLGILQRDYLGVAVGLREKKNPRALILNKKKEVESCERSTIQHCIFYSYKRVKLIIGAMFRFPFSVYR